MIERASQGLAQRFLGAVDLALDLVTLGEYGLEPLPADRPCRERSGHTVGREALAAGRRGGCGPVPPGSSLDRRSPSGPASRRRRRSPLH